MKRILGVVLFFVAAACIAVSVWQPWKVTPAGSEATPENLVTVTAVIGSEKKEFFNDPAVKKVFADNGYNVQVDTAGSREIATTKDLTGYDFAFPSSAPAAQKLAEKTGAKNTYSPFYSPMAVATWEPVIQLLAQNGIASQTTEGVWQIDVAKYLELVKADTRWKDLTGAAELYNSPRSVLISSTDIRKSNSAAMYLTVASYVLNNYTVVSTEEQKTAVLPDVTRIFLNQGFSGSSSDEPFRDYLTQGSGSSPLVMVYESQFVGEKMTNTNMPENTVLAYLSPTVFSKHVVVPLTETGDTIGKLLTENPELQQLAAEHGFRTEGTSFQDTITKNNIPGIEKELVNVAETPSYDVLESLINTISEEY